MALGYVTTDFQVAGDDKDFNIVFLCDEACLPIDIPPKTVFIYKKDVTLRDFTELFYVFDESWHDVEAHFVLFGIGVSDITKPEKELILERKLNTFNFHQVPNRKADKVVISFSVLINTIRELKTAKQIVSFDPISRKTTGFHNAAVDFIARRMERVDAQHHHFSSAKRLQLNRRRRKKSSENFPCIDERLVDGVKPNQAEIQFWAKAAIKLIDDDNNNDGDKVEIDGDFLMVKF